MRTFWDEVGMPIVVIMGTVALFFAMIGGAVYLVDGYSCNKLSKLTGMNSYYNLATGCLLYSQDGWVDSSVIMSRKLEVTVKGK